MEHINNGEIFKIGDIEFIKVVEADDVITAVTKDTVFDMAFGKSANFAESKILKKLKKEFLTKITAITGEENVVEFDTELTTVDGVKSYGKVTSKISLPTLDFYREHAEILDKYKLNTWWWLATAWSAEPHYNSSCVLCVSPHGSVDYCSCVNGLGVRPLLRFPSSIFVSCDE